MEHYSSTGEAGDESARSDYAVYESRDRLAAGRGDHLASVVPQPQEAELYLGEGCVAGGRLIKSARVKRGKQRKRCERRLLAGMIAHVEGNHHSGLKWNEFLITRWFYPLSLKQYDLVPTRAGDMFGSVQDGEPSTTTTKAFVSACEDAAIEGLIWHDLRTTYGIRLDDAVLTHTT